MAMRAGSTIVCTARPICCLAPSPWCSTRLRARASGPLRFQSTLRSVPSVLKRVSNSARAQFNSIMLKMSKKNTNIYMLLQRASRASLVQKRTSSALTASAWLILASLILPVVRSSSSATVALISMSLAA